MSCKANSCLIVVSILVHMVVPVHSEYRMCLNFHILDNTVDCVYFCVWFVYLEACEAVVEW